MSVLSFPFRVDPVIRNGPSIFDGVDAVITEAPPRSVVVLESGSDEEITEAVAAHVMVQPGERPMRPEFGTDSMSFGPGVSQGSLQLQLAEYGWGHVLINSVTPGEPTDAGYQEFTVAWERAGLI